MGSPLNPSIILASNNPPPVGAVQSMGLMMQQRQLASENALRAAQTTQAQQQTADLAAQAQIRNRMLADQATIQQQMGDPNFSKAIGAGDLSSLYGKVQPSTLMDMSNKITDHLTKLQTLHEDQLKDRQTAYDRIEETANGLKALITTNPDGTEDLSAVNANAPSAWQQRAQQGVFRDAGISTPPPANITSSKQLDQWLGIVGALQGATGKALELKGKEAEIGKNVAQTGQATAEAGKATAEAGKAGAETPGAAATSTIKQAEAGAMQNLTPENVASMVAGSIDRKKYPDQYQRTVNDASNALRLGLGVSGVQAAIKDGSDRVAQRENMIGQAQVTAMPFREQALQNQLFQRTQQSYQFHAAELDKLATPVTQLQERIQRLNDTIAQATPQSDAFVAPELLSIMAGGQGSGLRMNEAEISRAVGGRSNWESLKAAIDKWSLDPKAANSITPEQRNEIHQMADAVTQRANGRQEILMNARAALAGAGGPEQHRAILADVQNKLQGVNTAGSTPARAPGALPQIGDVVSVQGKKVKITAIHGDGTFDADPVK